MESIKKIEWKESLFKSIVYRAITILLGFSTAFIVTGSIVIAFGIALLTEFVQFANYFVFEIIWTHFRTRKKLEEELRRRIVDLEIKYDSIKELAYEMSRIDTFVKKVYDSTNNFFKSILKNEELRELHDEISKYHEAFKAAHEGRDLETIEIE